MKTIVSDCVGNRVGEPIDSQQQVEIGITLPPIGLNPEGLAELYSFLHYLQFKHETDLEAAIDYIEEELDILECKSVRGGNGETIAWSDIKAELGLV